MDATAVLLLLVAALAAGAGFAWWRARREADRQTALVATARAQIAALRTSLEYERAATAEKIALVEDSRERLADSFRSLSAGALESANRQFLDLADQRMREIGVRASGDLERRELAVEHLVAPLRETLGRVETQLREVESARAGSDAALLEQVTAVRVSSEQVRSETGALVAALRRPEARGRWGELQLRRLLEVSGMTERCDFVEQLSVSGPDGVLRPDVVVQLTGGHSVVVDAKVSLAAYLDAYETSDERVREDRLRAHARHLRQHVDSLAAKAYWQQFPSAPEFVLLFVPGDAFLAPALERDTTLLEYAISRKVHIASPTTLVSALRTIAYAWQQQALTERTQEVFTLGRQLYERLATLGGHVDKLGRSLAGSVRAYNETVGSLESRVLVPARKLAALGVVDGELPPTTPLEESPRPLGAPELLDGGSTGRPLTAVRRPTDDGVDAVPDREVEAG